MRFSFDESQLEFAAQLRSFAEKECTPADVRKGWNAVPGWSRERWAALVDMGVVGLCVPEGMGGLGLGMVDLVLLLEETGRSAMPEPVLANTCVAAPLLAEVARVEEDRRRVERASRLLAGIGGGNSLVAVGFARTEPLVANAVGSDFLLLEKASELHLVPSTDVTVHPRLSIDGARDLGEVEWEASQSTLLCGPEGRSRPMLDRAWHRAAMGAAATLVGVGDKLVSMAAGYALERKQFGKQIGSFQAVKHLLADALERVEFARPVVYRAALSLDERDPDAGRHASEAKALASEAAVGAARAALQVHGAIGYTWEADLHFWMKRAWSLASAWGDARFHRARVLEALLAERR